MFSLRILFFCIVTFSMSSVALDDPMRPPVYSAKKVVKKAKTVKLSLNGIISIDGREYAAINGKYLSMGDSIKGYRLTSIDSGKVVLLKNKKRLTLKLPIGNPVKSSGKSL